MTSPDTYAEITLTGTNERVRVTREEIERAAATVPTVAEDRVALQIGSRLVGVREVVAEAIRRPPSDVTAGEARRVLATLGFSMAGAPRLNTRSREDRDQSDVDPHPSGFEESGQEAVAALLDLEQSRLLRRYPGRWVALRKSTVVGDGASLRELMERVHPDPADPLTVLYVPSRSDAK